MSVIYKVITRPTDPRVPNSPKRYYPVWQQEHHGCAIIKHCGWAMRPRSFRSTN